MGLEPMITVVMTATALNIFGLVANIVGTIILAFSLNSYISSMRLAINAHELFMASFDDPRGTYVVTGTDVHMNKGRKKASFFSWLGVILVVAGFLLQLFAYTLPSAQQPATPSVGVGTQG